VICLLWRQHRGQALWTALVLTAFTALMVGVGLSANHWLAAYHQWVKALADAGCPPPDAHSGDFHVGSAATCQALRGLYPGALQPAFANRYNFTILAFQDGLPATLAIIGALVGAPLVAREIEQRTQLVSWTQSVSRRHWYATKVSILAAALAVAGLVVGVVAHQLQQPLDTGGLISSRWVWFFSMDLALAGQIVLAFALAVALGAWLRRTLPAVGAALASFVVLLLASGWAVRTLAPTTQTSGPSFDVPVGGWIIQTSQAHSVPYHPASQYWPLQLVFLAVLLALAAATLVLGWFATRTRAV
jgi:ABC-type transport system involved in multi-copper enzyme maturation permease subunit